jgi:hypothetical protein
MASDENCYSSPINRLETDTSSIVKHTELDTPIPLSSAVILMASNSSPLTSARLSETKIRRDTSCKFQYCSNRRQAAAKEIPKGYLGYRLCVRERYFARL